MTDAATVGRTARSFGFFIILGFVAVILAGPVAAVVATVVSLIVSVLAVVVPLALLGLLIWAPIVFFRNPTKAWADVKGKTTALARFVQGGILWCVATIGWGWRWTAGWLVRAKPVAQNAYATAESLARASAPVVKEACAKGYQGAVRGGEVVVTRTSRAFRYVGQVLSESFAGLGVGALLGALLTLGQPGFEESIGIGAAVGTAIGAAIGIARPRREPEVA